MPAAVGIKCRECARLPRSARVRLQPGRAGRALLAAFGLGTLAGVLFSFAGGIGVGFLSFIVAWLVGIGVGRATLGASGRYRSSRVGWIAAGGAAWAYVLPGIVIALVSSTPALAGVQVIGLLIAAFFAYREASP